MTDLYRTSGWRDSEVTGNPDASLTFAIDDSEEEWIIQLGHVTQPDVEFGVVLEWTLRQVGPVAVFGIERIRIEQ